VRLSTQSLSFNGALLKRGFWLYLWQVRAKRRTVYYVGRTGDSSSRYAGSPFGRVGMHFDLRHTARANSLIRRLRVENLDPESCDFRLVALGPIYPEQMTFELHVPIRNAIATLEHELASVLRERGFEVLGKHYPSAPLDKRLFRRVLRQLDASLE
jgi:hypothetical protein